MQRYFTTLLLTLSLAITTHAQVLIDSIPYPGMLSLGIWGIHVTPDTIFLGADGPGPIYFSDHDGNMLGNQPTGYTYNHGLIKRESSYLFAQSYTASGAKLHEVSLDGQLLNEWTFPPGIAGNSAGIGGLNEAGDGAIWFTVYHPYFQDYPYAFAYKWIPGTTTFLDTVPLHGKQPYGITLKGDTLLYVIDNIHGDQERIYAYDLTNEEDLFWFELPDTPIDNDQRPFGLHWDGNFLYLVANRQGGSAFAHQTLFIYDMGISTGIASNTVQRTMSLYPNPASDQVVVTLPDEELKDGVLLELLDVRGSVVRTWRMSSSTTSLDVKGIASGDHLLRAVRNGVPLITRKLVIVR